MSLTYHDITLMICGRLHQNGIENIPYYLSLGLNVIYSTWEPSNNEEIELLSKLHDLLPRDNITISHYKDVPSNYDTTQNVNYQAWSWHQGAIKCTTSYCIKMRSDLKFDYIIPLIDAFIMNPNKVLSVSAFFRNNKYYYCAGDFVIGLKTEEAIKVTLKLFDTLSHGIQPTTPAERKICLTILSCRNIIPSSNVKISKQQIINNYHIVDVNTLTPTLYWHKKGPYMNFSHIHNHSISKIEDY